MEKQEKKRIKILAVYAGILLFFMGVFFYFLRTPETCSDGIKNQNEENVDCGGKCLACSNIEAQSLIVEEAGLVPAGVMGEYDLYAIIVNPNNYYGSQEFNYELFLKNDQGEIVFQKKGSNYILPKEKKYIVENNLKLETLPTQIELKISDSQWIEFTDYYERPELKVINRSYNEIIGGVGFSEAKGILRNDSPFDFEVIKVKVILKNREGKVIGLNSTEMRTIKSKEERDFRAFWPSRFPGEVENVETQIDVNLFDDQIFLKKYFKTEKFQRYN